MWVWEQPDRDPEHWTRATLDSNEDGAIDAEFTQSYDRHFLPLVNDWIILTGSTPLLQQRETHARELVARPHDVVVEGGVARRGRVVARARGGGVPR